MTESPTPRVSIGLPVYNGEEYLEEAVDSILAQTYQDFELIISDNASTDRTAEICQGYAARDPRVRYSRNVNNIGGMNNANLALRLARGDYVHLAAHDDRCAPTLLERLVEELDKRPEATIACAATVAIDARGNILANRYVGSSTRHGRSQPMFTDDVGVRYPTEGTASKPHQRYRELILTRGPCEAQYGLIRTDVLRQTHYMQNYTSSDFALLCELALRGPFCLIREPLFLKRYHEANSYAESGPGRMAWSRPDLVESGRPSLPHWLELAGFVQALKEAPISRAERASCLLWVGRWMVMMRRQLAGDVVFAGKMLLHSKAWRKSSYLEDNWL